MRRSIRLESLEARDCPALTLQSLYGSLYIKGTPNGNLLIRETAANTFTVQDGAATLGVYPVQANLHVTLSSRPGFLRVDLLGRTLNGNLLIDLGSGYTGPLANPRDVSVYDSTAAAALGTGTIRGNVSVLRGDGRESVAIGARLTPPIDTFPITVRGNVTAVGLASSTFDDNFLLGDASVVRGSATVTHFDNVTFGEQFNPVAGQAAVLGNVTVTTAGVSGGLFSNFYGTFGRNITVNAAGATTSSNTFTIAPAQLNADTTVGGLIRVSQGQANVQNSFQVQSGAGTGRVAVTGTTQLISTNNSGSARDLYELSGEFAQTVTVQSANQGMDLTFTADGTINGNLNVTAGNGENNVGTQGPNVFVGSLTGAFNFRGGSGTNRVSVQTAVPNLFTFVGGNGTNEVSILPTAATQYNVDVLFGSGDNTLTLNNNVTLIGEVEAAAGASNTYNQNGANDINTTFVLFP